MLNSELPVKRYIKYHYGDLIQLYKSGEFDAIAHGCNCFCVMGSGIALSIAHEFPYAEMIDAATIKGDRNKLGAYTCIDTEYGKLYNAYTQYTTWDPNDRFSYDALISAFKAINDDMKASGLLRLGIPRIGAVRGGGDWGQIIDGIQQVCTDIEVHYVEYNGVVNK